MSLVSSVNKLYCGISINFRNLESYIASKYAGIFWTTLYNAC